MSAVARERHRDEGRSWVHARLAELHPESIAGAIYGTIVVAGVLATDPYDSGPNATITAITALGTVIVFWIAHSWAHYLARRAKDGPEARIGKSLRRDWPLVLSAIPPLVAIAVASLLGASDDAAIEIAEYVCTLFLAGWGALIAINERASLIRILTSAGVCAALGAVMVFLKVAVH